MPRRETVVEQHGTGTVEIERPTAPKDAVVETVMHRVRMALIEAPMGEAGNGYVSTHVEARLDQTQAKSLKSLVAGLVDGRNQTANGREVRTTADAVKWVLEKLAAGE